MRRFHLLSVLWEKSRFFDDMIIITTCWENRKKSEGFSALLMQKMQNETCPRSSGRAKLAFQTYSEANEVLMALCC